MSMNNKYIHGDNMQETNDTDKKRYVSSRILRDFNIY